jgi:hypothetical protein
MIEDNDNVVSFPPKPARELQQQHLAMYEPMDISYQLILTSDGNHELKSNVHNSTIFAYLPRYEQLSVMNHLTSLIAEFAKVILENELDDE